MKQFIITDRDVASLCDAADVLRDIVQARAIPDLALNEARSALAGLLAIVILPKPEEQCSISQ